MGPNLEDFMRLGEKIPPLLPAAEALYKQRLANFMADRPVASPTWLGYSIGRWEGHWFVVDTRGFNDNSWLHDSGWPSH